LIAFLLYLQLLTGYSRVDYASFVSCVLQRTDRHTWTQRLECPSVYLDTLHFLRFAFSMVLVVGFLAKCALFLCEATHTHTHMLTIHTHTIHTACIHTHTKTMPLWLMKCKRCCKKIIQSVCADECV